MGTHPYISGAGNVAEMISQLRKNFPSVVNSDTVKKLGIAPNNESYVINALQFIGLLDEEGKRIERGREILALGQDEFPTEFGKLIKESYASLAELHGDEMWSLARDKLINFFRKSDKTSAAIGGRQAALFQVFASLAGFGTIEPKVRKGNGPQQKKATPKKAATESVRVSTDISGGKDIGKSPYKKHSDVALTVRIEINLPAGGTKENYDNIFKSIRENLLNE